MLATPVVAIYRPPDRRKSYLNTAIKELKQVINKTQPAHIIVGGDFNLPGVNWEEKRAPPRTPHKQQAKILLSATEDLNLHQMVHIPTRRQNTLDLLFTDHPDLVNNVYSAPGLSDHDTVVIEHQLKATINKKEPREVPLYHRANWPEVKERIEKFSTEYAAANMTNLRPLNTNWSDIKDCISSCIADLIPHKKIGTRFHLPYITKPIQRKIRKRQRVYRKAKKSNRQKDWDQCHDLKREIKRELNEAFNEYINNMLNVEDDSPGMMKRFYRFVKSLRQDSFGVSTLKADGKIAATPKEKAEMCNAQFHSVFTPRSDPENLPQPLDPPLPRMPYLEITPPGIEKLLQNLNASKATGPDEIPARLLKECSKELAPVIAALYQQSLDEGEVPEDWKAQNVHPVFKKGSKSDPANYRPVALTAILCKQLEHCISSNIHSHLDKHNWLKSYQHGFRKLRSCVTQLLSATTDFFDAMEKGHRTDAIILDFSKAFDKVDHECLLRKLQSVGVEGNLLKWMRHFLTGRRQRVCIDGAASETCEVTSGVPQGSVLGPLLFIIYINDIGQGLSPDTTIRLFADDALLYRKIQSHEDHSILQSDLNRLMDWATAWRMEFNPKKCNVIHFMTIYQKKTQCAVPYLMGTHTLERVSDSAYLGVTLNEHLEWTTHTQKIAGMAHTTLSFLERNLRVVPQHLRERAYLTIVRPAFEYATAITDPYRPGDIRRLDSVQRHAARFVTNNPRRRFDPEEEQVSVTGLLETLDWDDLASRRKNARCTLLFNVLNEHVAVDEDLRPPTSSSSLRSTSEKKLKHYRSKKPAHINSFFPRTIRDWNYSLSSAARTATTLEDFKAALQ